MPKAAFPENPVLPAHSLSRTSPSSVAIAPIEPLVLTVAEACAAARIGRTVLFQLIRDRKLPAKKLGRRTFILRDDLTALMRSLPDARAMR
jgi:excisionase family DNA binding protein